MKRLVIAIATVAALGGNAFSQVSSTGTGVHPRHHEEMPNPASMRAHYVYDSSSHYQPISPGGRGR
jgi:hypothetical protein